METKQLLDLLTVRNRPHVCYLCGKSMDSDEVSRDHVPAKQFYPPKLRSGLRQNLITLEAHKTCNKSFQADEDYFIYSVGTVAHGTPAGTALVDSRILPDVNRIGYGERIADLILRDVSLEQTVLKVPRARVIKKFDSKRVGRILWKIVRGLWFLERRSILPEGHNFRFRVYSREEPPDPILSPLLRSAKKGDHPRVFAYWSLRAPGGTGKIWETWALLFWDAFLFFIVFHCPSCACADCTRQ